MNFQKTLQFAVKQVVAEQKKNNKLTIGKYIKGFGFTDAYWYKMIGNPNHTSLKYLDMFFCIARDSGMPLHYFFAHYYKKYGFDVEGNKDGKALYIGSLVAEPTVEYGTHQKEIEALQSAIKDKDKIITMQEETIKTLRQDAANPLTAKRH